MFGFVSGFDVCFGLNILPMSFILKYFFFIIVTEIPDCNVNGYDYRVNLFYRYSFGWQNSENKIYITRSYFYTFNTNYKKKPALKGIEITLKMDVLSKYKKCTYSSVLHSHKVRMKLCPCERYRQLNSVLYPINYILKSSKIIFNGLVLNFFNSFLILSVSIKKV